MGIYGMCICRRLGPGGWRLMSIWPAKEGKEFIGWRSVSEL